MTQNFVVTDKSDQYLLKFTLENTTSSFANALRRTIIGEVETAAFDTENYETSSLKVIENTSSLHNEFLLHRLGMIPIKVINTKRFDPSKYKFVLNVQNTTSKIIEVTTADFEVFDIETGKSVETLDFFPPNRLTGENILITRLKPNPNGEGEKIHVEGTCVINNGNFNARFSPVSATMYVNKTDPEKVEAALQKYLSSADGSVPVEQLKKRFMINESERYFITDENEEPNVFDFTIESVEILSSANILYLACEKLLDKLSKVKEDFERHLLGEDSSINVSKSVTVMDANDITLHNQSHTLGYLLQDYLLKFIPQSDLLFAGYNNPHPLEKKIVIRVALSNNNVDNLKEKIFTTIDIISKDLTMIRSKLIAEFGEDF